MRQMTEKFLKDAFAGESQAHMKYLAFADKAKKEGKPNVAKLFEAIAYAEKVHATNHLKELGEIKSTVENLKAAFAGETFEIDEMYPAYKATAELQHEKGALRSMNYALEAEKMHQKAYLETAKVVDAGKDIDIKSVHVCEICGCTTENEAPDKCPICGAGKDKFKIF
ncbi:MAG TPA: rubrerythrin family protein [Candidatus Wallbacteria bacterium]|nr:rubrerythrin family protein [Candidatus Wallbacteria bacterium]